MGSKICKDCQKEKLLEDFCLHKDSLDGRWNRCKLCMRERDRQQREKTKAKNAGIDPYALVNGEIRRKSCTVCKNEFPVTQFHRNANEPDGLSYLCKACSRKHTAASRNKNRVRNEVAPAYDGCKICTTCREEKPIQQFYRDSTKPDGFDYACRACSAGASRERRKKHEAAYQPVTEGTKVCSCCKVERPVAAFTVLKSAPDGLRYHCRSCEAEKYQAIRLGVLRHYSKGEPACAGCGCTDVDCLTVDHPKNDGAAHRKTIKGLPIYYWLKKEGYPEGVRILCWNCNCARQYRNKNI